MGDSIKMAQLGILESLKRDGFDMLKLSEELGLNPLQLNHWLFTSSYAADLSFNSWCNNVIIHSSPANNCPSNLYTILSDARLELGGHVSVCATAKQSTLSESKPAATNGRNGISFHTKRAYLASISKDIINANFDHILDSVLSSRCKPVLAVRTIFAILTVYANEPATLLAPRVHALFRQLFEITNKTFELVLEQDYRTMLDYAQCIEMPPFRGIRLCTLEIIHEELKLILDRETLINCANLSDLDVTRLFKQRLEESGIKGFDFASTEFLKGAVECIAEGMLVSVQQQKKSAFSTARSNEPGKVPPPKLQVPRSSAMILDDPCLAPIQAGNRKPAVLSNLQNHLSTAFTSVTPSLHSGHSELKVAKPDLCEHQQYKYFAKYSQLPKKPQFPDELQQTANPQTVNQHPTPLESPRVQGSDNVSKDDFGYLNQLRNSHYAGKRGRQHPYNGRAQVRRVPATSTRPNDANNLATLLQVARTSIQATSMATSIPMLCLRALVFDPDLLMSLHAAHGDPLLARLLAPPRRSPRDPPHVLRSLFCRVSRQHTAATSAGDAAATAAAAASSPSFARVLRVAAFEEEPNGAVSAVAEILQHAPPHVLPTTTFVRTYVASFRLDDLMAPYGKNDFEQLGRDFMVDLQECKLSLLYSMGFDIMTVLLRDSQQQCIHLSIAEYSSALSSFFNGTLESCPQTSFSSQMGELQAALLQHLRPII
ncbi:hypothetical protein HDU84_008439 [Entophlyctis sp. JEL0112]|nr:hypothetical protein HDU84_008439 [Entophlyctis sp. JEL0112]